MTDIGARDIADAIRDLAAAVREHTARMFPVEQPTKGYHCEHCGSPQWKAGGMGMAFRQCLDCGEIGEKIENAS